MIQRRLDPDLAEQVTAASRPSLRAAIVGLVGVGAIIGIDFLYAGHPSIVAYAAIALAFAVVEATVLGTSWRHRLITRRWAVIQQLERDEERRSITAARSASHSRRALITAEAEEESDDDRS